MPQRRDDGATCFIRNLPYDASSTALEDHFGAIGPVREAFVIQDRKTGKGRGIGFVTFSLPEDAARAVASTAAFGGRTLTVDIAKSKTEAQAAHESRGHGKRKAPDGGGSVKKAKAESAGTSSRRKRQRKANVVGHFA